MAGMGAAQACLGLAARRRPVPTPELTLPAPRTVVLVPICNEDPVSTFARIAAMDQSLQSARMTTDIAILSDTRDPDNAAIEEQVYRRLIEETDGVAASSIAAAQIIAGARPATSKTSSANPVGPMSWPSFWTPTA